MLGEQNTAAPPFCCQLYTQNTTLLKSAGKLVERPAFEPVVMYWLHDGSTGVDPDCQSIEGVSIVTEDEQVELEELDEPPPSETDMVTALFAREKSVVPGTHETRVWIAGDSMKRVELDHILRSSLG